MAVTPNLLITLPTPSTTTSWGSDTNPASVSTTGSGVNYVFNQFDAIFATAGDGTSVGLNVGSGKTFNMAGTMQASGTTVFGTDGSTATGGTIRAGDKTGNNVTGPSLTIQSGNGTGTTGASGSILFKTASSNSGGASSDPTVMATRMTITKEGYVGVGQASPTYTLDVGVGGTGSTNAQQNARLNGSSAGIGTAGGYLFAFANNSVTTGAIGNYSTIMGGTTAYTADLTIASASTLRFFTNATIAGAAASNERFRIGTSGEIGVWDATLTTPAINYGTSGQVLRSNGSGSAVSWGSATAVLIAPAATAGSVGTGTTFTITSSSIPAGYKVLEMFMYGVSHNNSNGRSLQIEIQGNSSSTWYGPYQVSPSADKGIGVTGTIKIVDASSASATRYIISITSTGDGNATNAYSAGPSVTTGYINAIRFSWSTSSNFDSGYVSLVGYN